MVGGVLADRTVKDIKPSIAGNRDRLMTMIDHMNGEVKKKVEMRNQFIEK